MGLRSIVADKIRKSKLTKVEAELERIQKYPRFTPGYTDIFGRQFRFRDSLSFVITYREIFINKIYAFKAVTGKSIILDCGANMGLGTLYFSRNYPDHIIYAFEPDPQIYQTLKENIDTLNLRNVVLLEKAIWDKEETLTFYGDNGMGSRANTGYLDQTLPTNVESVRLYNYLTSEVDFLKLDIEGAENTVLRDCKERLQNLGSFFFEYHNDVSQAQMLDELLAMVKDAGFHYYIKESWTRTSPFADKELIGGVFDMAINVFCYRHS